LKPANWVHVAGFCVACGIVAYYLTRPLPAYYDPEAHAQDQTLARLTRFDLASALRLNNRDDIWNRALAYEHAGRNGDALGCYELFLALYPDDPAAVQARQRIAVLEPAPSPKD